jgi:hypothetical protein
MAKIFNMAKMCLKPKKRHTAPVPFQYKKKFLGVGGRKVTARRVIRTLRALRAAARFAASPAAETSKTDPADALPPRQQLFLIY